MVRAMAGRSVAVAPATVARQQVVQRLEQVGVRPRAQLHDHEAGSGVRHIDAEQPVPLPLDERSASPGEVGKRRVGTRADRELDGLQGKIERSASRIRPSPPIAGALS